MHCPILLVLNLDSKGHSLFSTGTYKSCINCRLLMVWYVAHMYKPRLSQYTVTVPLLPAPLHKYIYQSHDIPTSRHQDYKVTYRVQAVPQYHVKCVLHLHQPHWPMFLLEDHGKCWQLISWRFQSHVTTIDV